MKKAILAAFLIGGLSTATYAVEAPTPKFDPEVIAICNKVMINIYKDILKSKDKYKHLKSFDEKAIYENKYGIYTILYKYEPEEGEDKKSGNYEFGLTIDGIDDVTFPDKRRSFNLAFPLLGLKFSGYKTKITTRTQYDIAPTINRNGAVLSEYQQKFMPLQMTIRALQNTYKIRENIEFEVVLKNVSKRHMVVKSLGMDTLYFLFEDMVWGTSPDSQERGGEDAILKSGGSLSLKFKGESFQKPRDIQIYCAYRMSIKGVNPAATLNLKIIDDPMNPADLTPHRSKK
jgi:hypothetical protein